MSKVILALDSMPKSCDQCRLFVSIFGHRAYCTMGAKYTAEEIAAEKDGNLSLYYHGCLSNRPKSCPLKEEVDNSAWDFRWDGRGNYEQERAAFYGDFS